MSTPEEKATLARQEIALLRLYTALMDHARTYLQLLAQGGHATNQADLDLKQVEERYRVLDKKHPRIVRPVLGDGEDVHPDLHKQEDIDAHEHIKPLRD